MYTARGRVYAKRFGRDDSRFSLANYIIRRAPTIYYNNIIIVKHCYYTPHSAARNRLHPQRRSDAYSNNTHVINYIF